MSHGAQGKGKLQMGWSEVLSTAEMRALENIEVAFLPMNLPYTMTVQQAADAVADFRPVSVFPYHHRGSDVQEFARLVEASDAGSLVVIANWYPRGQEG